MKKIIVLIDDSAVELDFVYPFYQKLPFPGGHFYKLEILFNNEDSLSKFINNSNLDKFEEINWSIFFLQLAGLWPESKTQKTAHYLINTVESIEINEEVIILNGICSPVR